VARQIQRYVKGLPMLPSNSNSWTASGVQVRYTTNKFVVVDPTRGRRAS
jgi:hypothetical protein